MIKSITHNEISHILGGIDIPKYVIERMEKFPLMYQELSKEKYEKYLVHVLNVLFNPIVKSGKHRLPEWENGWNENFEEFSNSKNVDLLIPKYHGKNNYIRWNGEIVEPLSPKFDYNIHINFIDSVIENYLKGIENVYEFGCGPGYHLLRLSGYHSDLNFFGLDWATSSQNIINKINEIMDKKIEPHRFDFFEPDNSFEIKDKSVVYTVAALEQVGDNYKKFINYLLEKKPNICIHFEPISELLDENKLNDLLSIQYFKNRNYLNGFLDYLKLLEQQNKIKIIDQRRIYSGSYFIEGHSLVVWEVL